MAIRQLGGARVAAVLLLAAALPVAAQQASSSAQESYRALSGEEKTRAGEPEFDYRLGRAALDAGDASKATLVFERLLLVDPKHAAARLDLARAYYYLGNRVRAREEFEAVRQLDPPAAARVVIDRYLALLDQQGSFYGLRASGYAEAGFGRDTNVTVGPRQNSLMLPAFGVAFDVSDDGRARGDSHHQIGVGGELSYALDANRYLFLGGDLKFRNYRQVNDYDQLNTDLRGGLSVTQGIAQWRAFGGFNDVQLGGHGYQKVATVGSDVKVNLDASNQILALGQVSTVRYGQEDLKTNDYNLYTLGLGWIRLPSASGVALQGLAFLGKEEEKKLRTDGDKLFYGVKGGVAYGVTSSIDLYAGAGWQKGHYSRENELYAEKRRDTQYDAMLSATWRFSPGWSLRSQVQWTRNDSNTSVNAYQRSEAGVYVRRDF